MAKEMPQMISKSLIKPSAPTPKHLKTYSFSMLDRLAPHFYLPIVLFYPAPNPESSCKLMSGVSSYLKKSLSETLSHYYPFAGRVAPGKDFIDCNDEGLDFYEARIDSKLVDVLEKPDPETMDLFSPPGILFNERFQGSPIIVQITYFSCGGIALSISMLHKVTDACALFGFCTDWAAVARGGKVSPVFLSQVISPFCGEIIPSERKLEKNNVVTRRFTFDPSKLAELKAIVADTGMLQNPTRVEVVTALIYMRAMSASKAKSGISGPSILNQAANLRPRVVPPLPENSVGNFSWFFSINSCSDEKDKGLESIAAALRKAASGFSEKYANGLNANGCYSLLCESIEGAKKMIRENREMEVYMCSSLCRYSFNQMDFGWGKPIWMGTSSSKVKNTFHLLDSLKSGGIEALVTLEEEKMAIFENDQELLRFAVLNPTAIYG